MNKVLVTGIIAVGSFGLLINTADAANRKPIPKVSVTYRMVDSRSGAVLRTQKVTYNKNAKAIKSYTPIYGYNTPRATNFKVTYSQTKTIMYAPKQFTITNRFYNTVTHTYLANKVVKAYYNQNFNDAPTVGGYIRPAAQRFVVKGNVTRTFNVLANKGSLQNPVTFGTKTVLGNNVVSFSNVNDDYVYGTVVSLTTPGLRSSSTRTMNDYLANTTQENFVKWQNTYLFGAQQLRLTAGNSWLSVPVDSFDDGKVMAVRLLNKDGANVVSPLAIHSDKMLYLGNSADSSFTTKLYGNSATAWDEGGLNADFDDTYDSYVQGKAHNTMYFRIPNTIATQDLRLGFQMITGQWVYYRPSATTIY